MSFSRYARSQIARRLVPNRYIQGRARIRAIGPGAVPRRVIAACDRARRSRCASQIPNREFLVNQTERRGEMRRYATVVFADVSWHMVVVPASWAQSGRSTCINGAMQGGSYYGMPQASHKYLVV